MKNILNLITVCTLTLSTFTLSAHTKSSDISQHAKPATLRVVAQKDLSTTYLEIKGCHHIYNPLDGSTLSRGMLNKKHTVTLEEYGLNWGEKIPGIYQIRIVPLDTQTTILIGGIQYKGCVEIHAEENQLNVINEIDIESFLKITLPSQFKNPLPPELLNALTILARTQAYYIASKNKQNSFDLDGTSFNYQESMLSTRVSFIDEAVDTTRHAVLTFHGKPFPAQWTQDSAGKTASFSTIFRKTALTPPPVNNPLALKNLENRRWHYVVSKEAIAEEFGLEKLTSLDLFIDQDSEKVYALKLASPSHSKEIDFVHFQQIIGKENLLSNRFAASLKGDSIIFTGYGEGLGVGLCLYTGKILASRGKKATEILGAFFPYTELHKIRSLEK